LSSSDSPQFEPKPVVNSEPQVPMPSASHPFATATITSVPTAPPPVENPVWNGWDVLLIAVLAFVAMVVLELAVVLAAQRLAYPHESLVDIVKRPIVLLILQFLIYIPVVALMFALVEGKYHVAFWQAIRWNWPRSGWRLLVLGAATFFALSLLENWLPMPKDTPFGHLFDGPRDAYLLATLAVSIGPLMEELFFRGFLYSVVARRWGVRWGIFLAALPFALLHLRQYGYAWGVVLVIFLVGVVCGVVRAVTRSVGASFLVHAGYNGSQMLIAIVLTHGFRHMPKA
jgi:membrane protease YdiL (CAAX protease family)